MIKKQNIVPLKELNLVNRFLFDEVMEDREVYQDVLEIIFGKKIALLDQPQTEKELRVSPMIRSVRMDVFAMDEEHSIYNTEMQDTKKSDLAKRSRYYQSLIDTSLLEPGIPNYNVLNQSFIILIMTFDLFGYEKYKYTFEYKCREVPECSLGDGVQKIFLNTRVKLNEEIGVKYVQAWEEKYYEREEGREEGRVEGREEGRLENLVCLVCRKIVKGLSVPDIADTLEEDEKIIKKICDTAGKYAPNYDIRSIVLELLRDAEDNG